MSSLVPKCRGCGRIMVWGRNMETGALIPLDSTAPVYRIVRTNSDGVAEVQRDHGAFVSHFATCRCVDQFKRAKGGDDVPPGDSAGPDGTGKPEDS